MTPFASGGASALLPTKLTPIFLDFLIPSCILMFVYNYAKRRSNPALFNFR